MGIRGGVYQGKKKGGVCPRKKKKKGSGQWEALKGKKKKKKGQGGRENERKLWERGVPPRGREGNCSK